MTTSSPAPYNVGDNDICECGAYITLATDGAWEDMSGACGCDGDEHLPARGPYNTEES